MEKNGKRFGVSRFKVGSHACIVVYEIRVGDALPYIKHGAMKASKLLTTENDIIVTVSYSDDNFVKRKMDGVNGFTSNGYALWLGINTGSPDWRESVEGTVIHEFNHAIRFQRTRKTRNLNLADRLALEGLAQCFAEELTGVTRPWSDAISEAEAKRVWDKIKGKLDVKSRDLSFRIFLNNDDKEFPHWSGYTISYLIIKKRLKELKGKDWNEVIGKSSKALMKGSPQIS